MRAIRRILSRGLAVLLCALLFLPLPARAADLYFTAINESICFLTSSTMPFWSSGMLYVPYTVFDAGKNGIGVGVGISSSYTGPASTRLTLYTSTRALELDLPEGTCRDDISGEVFAYRAIIRNGLPFLPLEMVCRFFGLNYSYNSLPDIPQGYLIRIKNSEVVLTDSEFIESAGNLLNKRLQEYTQSLNSAATTSPNTGTSGNQGSAVTDDPSPSNPGSVSTYLAVTCQSADGINSILNTLDLSGVYAVFFCTPELLEQEGDLVRRILGTGHSVGLLAQGADVSQTRRLLEDGAQALARTALTRTTLAYVPAEQRATLEGEGWVCWEETLALSPDDKVGAASFATPTMGRLSGRTRTTYLTLEGGANGARVLSALLRRLDRESFDLGIPMETRL